MFRQKTTAANRRERKLETKVAELETEVDRLLRVLSVRDAEISNLAAVVARDRVRIQAEAASFARQKAESEGQNE